MTLDFYYMQGSPPCSVVSLVFAAVGVEHKVKTHFVDVLAKEHLSPKFLKINPQHMCPTIVDDGFALWESRTIAKYLVGKYGTKLYPEDLKTRAIIDQRLDFDCGTLYPRFSDYFFFGAGPADERKITRLHGALAILNAFLESSKYAAGPELTLADYGLAVTVSLIQNVGFSVQDYPNILRWQALVRSTISRYEEINGKYMRDFKEFWENWPKI